MQQSQPESGASRDEIVRQWLSDLIKSQKVKPTPFANAAGVAPSTLFRTLEGKGGLDPVTIDKIREHYKVPGPTVYGVAPTTAPGFFEAELASYTSDVPTWWKLELTPRQGLWTVRTRGIELVGVLPDDVILVDSNVRPRIPREGELRDIVVAQIITADSAETVLRVYDHPYLVTETTDPAARRKPLAVDNERVSIWGVQIKLFRERKV